jgi:hypothetical protein
LRLRTLLSCSLLALCVAGAAAADPALVTLTGKVEIGRGTPPVWRLAKRGDALAPGDSVRTAAGARAELALGDQRIVRVYEQSVLRVGTSVTPTGAVRSVDLDQGQSIFDVMKKTLADEFDVITPEIVVSVKGTRFLVAAVAGTDYTACFRGEVGLAGEGFEAVSVRPGMLGADGELYLAPFADPWAAWEAGASAPEPMLDEGREREVGAALQAAVAGSAGAGGSRASAAADDGGGLLGLGDLLGGLLGENSEQSAAASAPVGPDDGGLVGGATTLVGDLLAPVSDPLLDPSGGETLVAGTTDLLGDLLAPVSDAGGGLAPLPVVDPLLDPVVTPVTDGSLLSPAGGLLGGLRSP